MNNLTGNLSLLPVTSFKLVLNSHEFANIEFFAVSVQIPSVSLSAAATKFRNKWGFEPGDSLVYEPLQVRLAVDENMKCYKEVFDWIKGHTNQTDLKMSDITLIVMSSHNNPNVKFKFVNAFPTSLGQIEFNAQQGDVEYAFIDVTFQYDYFEMVDDSLACP